MSDIVKSVSIENLLNQREGIMSRLSSARLLIQEAAEMASSSGFGGIGCFFETWRNNPRHVNILDTDAIQKAQRHLDAAGWEYLMKESGMRSFMNAEARAAWSKSLLEGNFPAFTKDNIGATFARLHDSRGEMFVDGVISVFRRLSWNYKTNQPFKFGKRVIIEHLMSYGSPNSHQTNELDDLMRVLHILDGKPEPDHRNGMYALISTAAPGTEGENDYLQLRWYKKGTGHVMFKRLDLVDELNLILAKRYPNALSRDKK